MILKNNPFYFYFFLNQLLLNTVVNAQEFKNIYSTYTDQSIELDGKDIMILIQFPLIILFKGNLTFLLIDFFDITKASSS